MFVLNIELYLLSSYYTRIFLAYFSSICMEGYTSCPWKLAWGSMIYNMWLVAHVKERRLYKKLYCKQIGVLIIILIVVFDTVGCIYYSKFNHYYPASCRTCDLLTASHVGNSFLKFRNLLNINQIRMTSAFTKI